MDLQQGIIKEVFCNKILEDNYSDLETQKFDITASDDYEEEQVNQEKNWMNWLM